MIKSSMFFNKNLGSICLWVFLALLVPFIANAADNDPPYLVSPVPEPNSSVGEVFTVKVGVVDDESGVDPNSIRMWVNDAPVEPIIEPSYSNKGYRLYVPDLSAASGSTVTVKVRALDNPAPPVQQNEMVDSWHFAIVSMGFHERLQLIYPAHGSWLDFDAEQHEVRFIWSQALSSEFYRMDFQIKDQHFSIDFDRNSYSTPFGCVAIEFQMDASQWEMLNSTGEMYWKVAPIDQVGGNEQGQYTETHSVKYVSGQYPLPESPRHGAVFGPDNPPLISWQTLDGVSSYYVIFVRLEGDFFTSDIQVDELPFLMSELKILAPRWATFNEGDYAWTVIGAFPGGVYSDFLINRFRKTDLE